MLRLRKYLLIAVLFALISSLRVPYLPVFQFALIIMACLVNNGINFKVLVLLVIVLCTHHFAVPDSALRFDSDAYPSIYTLRIGPFKVLDMLVVFLAFVSVHKLVYRFFDFIKIRSIPVILLLLSFIGFVNFPQLHLTEPTFIFYIIRSYLIVAIIFVNCRKLTKEEFRALAYIAVVSWISKMCFAILFPHPHPLYRQILGINGIIFFAGDEYMYIPVYVAIIVHTYEKNFHAKQYKQVRNMILFSFILAIIAQRKGAISVLIPFLVLICCYYKRSTILTGCIKLYYLFSSTLIFSFLIIEDIIINNKLVKLAFLEYHTLADVSVKSIFYLIQNNLFGFLLGITPFGRYEIIDLPSFADHAYSFGEEAGEQYRYTLWSFPFGRVILNCGLIGLIIYFVFSCKAMRKNAPLFFIITSTFIFCTVGGISPVNALNLGMSLALLFQERRSCTSHSCNEIAIKGSSML